MFLDAVDQLPSDNDSEADPEEAENEIEPEHEDEIQNRIENLTHVEADSQRVNSNVDYNDNDAIHNNGYYEQV